MSKALEHKRFAFLLPNLFTALNMGCGHLAMILATQEKFYLSCIVIGLGALFDLVDGRIARMTGTQSSFGEQFDSLSDLITFGVAPAFVYYFLFLKDSGRIGLVISFIYVLCGALRLARFNANVHKVPSNYFQGIPIPGAALGLIGLVMFSREFQVEVPFGVSVIVMFFYAILMISNVAFPSFKQSEWVANNKKKFFIFIVAILVSTVLKEELMVLVWMKLYVSMSLIRFLFNRKEMKQMFEWEDKEDAQ